MDILKMLFTVKTVFSEQKLPVFLRVFTRLPAPSKSDFEMTARPKRRVDGSLAKTLTDRQDIHRLNTMNLYKW